VRHHDPSIIDSATAVLFSTKHSERECTRDGIAPRSRELLDVVEAETDKE